MEATKIYSLSLRILHGHLAISIVILLASAYLTKAFYERGDITALLWKIHIYFGYVLILVILSRIGLFFVGNQRDRFKGCYHSKVQFIYLAFYLILLPLFWTGLQLAAIEHNAGPMAESMFDDVMKTGTILENHELQSMCVLLFITLHLIGIYLYRIQHRVPIFQSMWSGMQYKNIKEEKNVKNDLVNDDWSDAS